MSYLSLYLVAREGGIPGPGLEPQPALVLELLLSHVLSELNGPFYKEM